jgi:hypothetical protein
MVKTRSMTKKAKVAKAPKAAKVAKVAKAAKPTRRSKRLAAKKWAGQSCWHRMNSVGHGYTVCSHSQGQKGVYKKGKGGTRRAGRR